MTEASEAGDDFVRDIEHVILAANFQRAAVVSRRRNDHASGGEHRLGDERGHVFRAHLDDGVLQIRHLLVAPGFDVHAFRPNVRVYVRKKSHQIPRGIDETLVPFLARNTRRQIGGAVIALFPRDEALFLRPSAQVVIKVGKPQRGIHGGRPAGGEKHRIEIAGRELAQLARQQRRRLVGEGPRSGVGERAGLRRDGVGHFLVSVTDLHVPHAARTVDVATSLRVEQIDAFCPGRDHPVGRVRSHGLPRMKKVPVVPAPHRLGRLEVCGR